MKRNLPLHYKRHPLPRFGSELLVLNTTSASGTTKRPPQTGVPGVSQHGVHIIAEAPGILRIVFLSQNVDSGVYFIRPPVWLYPLNSMCFGLYPPKSMLISLKVCKGHFQLQVYFWLLDAIVNCLMRLAIMSHEDRCFQVPKPDLIRKGHRSKWRFFFLFKQSHRPFQWC